MLISQGTRPQRSLHDTAEVSGVSFLRGAPVRVRFHPARPGTGIVFRRTDLPNSLPIHAKPGNVTGTNRRTTLGRPPGQVELVEHALAALHGLRIDNCLIEIDGPELPGLDGSARDFVDVFLETGVIVQDAERAIWGVTRPITVADGPATLTLYPDETPGLRISYLLDFGLRSPIGPQRHTHRIVPEEFCDGLDDARTFLLKEEAEALMKQGLGTKASVRDVLVFGPRGPIENTLRASDEPARHKILDIVGDLALVGCELAGHVVGCRSGHTLNVALAGRLRAEIDAAKPRTLRRAA